MPFEIVRNDITNMKVDAIVNAANTRLKMGGGVCGAIFSAAGAEKLQAECDRIGGCETGKSVITGGYALPARYIIHAVGPIWMGGGDNEKQLLHSAYTSALVLAEENRCQSVAFPLVSSGIYGYPKDQAIHVAISAIGEFLLEHDMMVYLVVFDEKAFSLSEKLTSSIREYIDANYVENAARKDTGSRVQEFEYAQESKPKVAEYILSSSKRSLEDVVEHLDETFSAAMLRLIDEKKMADTEVYKKANLDRKLFSKIRSDAHYKPGRATAIALSIALKLNLDETLDLMGKAGYTLSNSNKSDVIIKYFIEKENHNIFEVNEALFAFGQPVLGR
ncbi:macro domain-containing protein [Parasporobacterium paucivorans]|uniref:O-acetyl-ADP-ribose deacetylase (Regulator of RNase III), contains Macro domain n=1 Tax=Parasporobacterium paucivorans DSM 15970 TaxID=1122934 RepID=A0A1M6J1G3_9FIRM|nr:macro domain-containing protein [Parasporobacterium paucivorans]SHJ40540.1 O-acetyl-ADP-ribose deacetylase (regulator of RNase III), contains Macro domain [Parasporobacterium paucivorans DSM 15970]